MARVVEFGFRTRGVTLFTHWDLNARSHDPERLTPKADDLAYTRVRNAYSRAGGGTSIRIT